MCKQVKNKGPKTSNEPFHEQVEEEEEEKEEEGRVLNGTMDGEKKKEKKGKIEIETEEGGRRKKKEAKNKDDDKEEEHKEKKRGQRINGIRQNPAETDGMGIPKDTQRAKDKAIKANTPRPKEKKENVRWKNKKELWFSQRTCSQRWSKAGMVGMVDMAMTWVDGDMFVGYMIERERACCCWLLVVLVS